ncbi:hypothetical protein ECZU51_59600 [Escherichia coli]|nr:hypothetical protein ECZU51_59600 [Escherichia coli]
MEGETAKSERVNDRKITADGKEDRVTAAAKRTLHPARKARLRWRHGTARTRHDGFIPETHKAMPRMAGCGAAGDVLIPASREHTA